MKVIHKNYTIEKYHLSENGHIPNSPLPVIIYKGVLTLPFLFPAAFIKTVFRQYNWSNAWTNGIYGFNHYHSTTHEVLGIYKGSGTLQFGGEFGERVMVKKGDVIIIPAGVAHKNLTPQIELKCVGAYPDGKNFDMNYGKPEERTRADANIRSLPIPAMDPVFGKDGKLVNYWKR
ncbi:MAG: cupin domain-containing protein [Bacteroidota bacterium]